MFLAIARSLLWPLLGASAAALIAVSVAGATNNSPLIVAQTNSTTLQTALQGSMSTPVLLITNFSTAAGAYGLSVNGNSSSAPAIGGGNGGTGIGFRGLSVGGIGAFGIHTSTSGAAAGVEGDSNSTASDAAGVLGRITSTSPATSSAGVRGINNGAGSNGYGVWGSHAGGGQGVYGTSESGQGVYGYSGSGYGVFGLSSNGFGVFGHATSGGTGVRGEAPAGLGFAAVFSGAVKVQSGALAMGVVAFTAGNSTPSVAAGNVFDATATMQNTYYITGFTDGAPGQTITIVCHGFGVSFVDSSPLFLNGAYDCNEGRTIVLVTDDGSNWYELSRSTN